MLWLLSYGDLEREVDSRQGVREVTFKLRSAGEKQAARKDGLFREASECKGHEVGKLKLLARWKK